MDGLDVGGTPTIKHDLNVFPYPIKNETYDTVIAGDIIEHVLKPYDFLLECHRILKANGTLILTTANATSLYYITNPNVCGEGDNPHVYAWTPPQFEKLVKRAYFHIVDKGLITAHWNANIIARAICALIPNTKTEIILVARKEAI